MLYLCSVFDRKITLTQKKSCLIKNGIFLGDARSPLKKNYAANSEDMTKVSVINDNCFVIISWYLLISELLLYTYKILLFSFFSSMTKETKENIKRDYFERYMERWQIRGIRQSFVIKSAWGYHHPLPAARAACLYVLFVYQLSATLAVGFSG